MASSSLRAYQYQTVSAAEAVKIIQSHHQVFIHSIAATPLSLVDALTQRADELEGVGIHHIHTEGAAPYADRKYEKSFRVNNLFVGANLRQAVHEGRADYVPIFLSEVPLLFRRRIIDLDVALLQVSMPDDYGFCTLGTSVDISLAAAESAKIRIAEINPQMPRTHGDGVLHISKFDKIVEVNRPLIAHQIILPNPVETKIGQIIAELIEDGSTLQMGIGAVPDAVLAALGNHKQLGIHTEMFSDGVIPLVVKGVITNELKRKHRNHIVTGFVMGSQEVYDFVNDNPFIRMLDIGYINDTSIIRQNPKVVAINSCIEVDLTGQVVSDSIGSKIYSGVGGQMDFIRGASLSEGGKPIIALPSTTSKGESRIVSMLKPGAGVVTTRANVHYVVTEYGAVNLFGKNIRERAKLLISIAHPQYREELERQAHDLLKLKV